MLMNDTPSQAEALAIVTASARMQPYRAVHKALRGLMAQTLEMLGRTDADDPTARAQALRAVDELLDVCAGHLAHENRFFHAALHERAPRAALPFDNDHDEHLAEIARLRERAALVRDAGAQADAAAYCLYLELSRFVAENLEHMAEEETLLTRALWQHFRDDEILHIEGALVASLSPEEKAMSLRWMARMLSPAELAPMLSAMRASMPAEAFDAVLAEVFAQLDAPRHARLAQRLGVAAVPGLVEAGAA